MDWLECFIQVSLMIAVYHVFFALKQNSVKSYNDRFCYCCAQLSENEGLSKESPASQKTPVAWNDNVVCD